MDKVSADDPAFPHWAPFTSLIMLSSNGGPPRCRYRVTYTSKCSCRGKGERNRDDIKSNQGDMKTRAACLAALLATVMSHTREGHSLGNYGAGSSGAKVAAVACCVGGHGGSSITGISGDDAHTGNGGDIEASLSSMDVDSGEMRGATGDKDSTAGSKRPRDEDEDEDEVCHPPFHTHCQPSPNCLPLLIRL